VNRYEQRNNRSAYCDRTIADHFSDIQLPTIPCIAPGNCDKNFLKASGSRTDLAFGELLAMVFH